MKSTDPRRERADPSSPPRARRSFLANGLGLAGAAAALAPIAGRAAAPLGAVDRALLEWCRASGRRDRRVRAAMAHLAARTRAVYRHAAPGIALLAPESRPCVSVAFTLYQGILDELAAADYDVFGRRAVVPTSRRLAVALPGLVRALLAR